MRPLSSPFVSQPGWRSAQRRGGARLLVINSLLISTAAAAMPVSKPGSRAVDAMQRTSARTRPSVTDTNQPQPFLSLAMTANPEAAAIGEQVLLRLTERRLGNASGVVKQQYAYTAAENFRLVSLKAGTSPTYDNRQKINYTYDDDGNVLTITDAAAYGGSQTQAFAYDTLDRLSTAQASGSTTYGGYTQRSYAYSNAGNITSFEGAALAYNATAHKHAVTHIGGVQKYWYDANGNATRRVNGSQDITLTYDAENRLTAMSGSVTASYVYDGNRVKETIGPIFGHELHESKRRQKLDSCKLVKFVAEKAGRILATNDTN